MNDQTDARTRLRFVSYESLNPDCRIHARTTFLADTADRIRDKIRRARAQAGSPVTLHARVNNPHRTRSLYMSLVHAARFEALSDHDFARTMEQNLTCHDPDGTYRPFTGPDGMLPRTR